MQAAAAGKYDASMGMLRDASQVAGDSADVEFLRARVLLAAGRRGDALDAFSAARDQDRLRFRADSTINGIIREAVHEVDDPTIVLADVEKAMERTAPGGIPGAAYFLEHVHLTFEGTSVIAREIVRTLSENMAMSPFENRRPGATLKLPVVLTPDLKAYRYGVVL
jgi:hypothetical protein